MKIEVLISTMNQKDMKLIQKMNIKTDALIVNQSNHIDYEEINLKNNIIRMFTFNEKGIGRSRNNALMRATGDICLLADDDMVYEDNYIESVLDAFKRNPKADLILFNVPSNNTERPTANIFKNSRINYFNFMRYGAVNIAFRKYSILKANVYFSLLFGGGSVFSAGEDSLFLYECLKKGLLIYSDTAKIATVFQDTSTWFNGYNEKYFFDKGVFFTALSRNKATILMLQFLIRKYSLYKDSISPLDAYKRMVEGMKYYKTN